MLDLDAISLAIKICRQGRKLFPLVLKRCFALSLPGPNRLLTLSCISESQSPSDGEGDGSDDDLRH